MKPRGSKRLEVIQTKGVQFASVPNTIAGREWIHSLRGYLNRGEWRLVALRGRAKDRRRKGGSQTDTPTRTADWLAVYIEPTKPKSWAVYKVVSDASAESAAYNSGYRAALAGLRGSLAQLVTRQTDAMEECRTALDFLEDEIQSLQQFASPAPAAGEAGSSPAACGDLREPEEVKS